MMERPSNPTSRKADVMQATIFLSEMKQEEPAPLDQRQPASTALAPIEEPVIEGEVTGVIEPEPPPPPKQRPYYLLPLFTLLVCLLIVGVSHMWQLLTPSATVLLIPREEHISTTAVIPIHGRLLPALTLSQSTTVPATGKRHQFATRAEGAITFYNGLFTSQTIEAGTILNGADGIEIITDQAAVIPAGNPPIYGQVTISAHALNTGSQGNIQAFDINQACCLTSVLAKNTTAFQGGRDARDFLVVTQHDVDRGAATITATLEKSEHAALQTQVDPGEALITPLCSEKITADHQVGGETKEVTVTLSETCSSIAYPAHTLSMHATQMLTAKAMQRFGTGYRLVGDIQASIIHTTVTDQAQGIVTIMVKMDAIYVYQINPGEKQQLVRLIAGKSNEQAVQAILQLPGIQGAAINSNAGALPEDIGKIIIIIVNRSA